jgi:hypothetical protein
MGLSELGVSGRGKAGPGKRIIMQMMSLGKTGPSEDGEQQARDFAVAYFMRHLLVR